jgi:hypothetical protein
MMRALALLLMFALIPAAFAYEGCTVAVISGKATPDGRPLLWKNRDSSFRDNEVAFFKGTRYDFIGVINAGDTTQVWMGVNTAGLAIMNSESMDQPGDSADTEGFFIKAALEVCGRLEDIEELLKKTNGSGRGTRANFGCIDAFGGAAFFETGNRSFTRVDAEDTLLTHGSFLVRANFSMTGQGQEGYGSWRYHRARNLIQEKAASRSLTYDYILQTVSRDLISDEVDPRPLPFNGTVNHAPAGCLYTQNSINRHRTVSCAVFQGVKPGERPSLTTMWCFLGEPICSVAVPLWPIAGPVSDMLDGPKKSVLNQKMTNLHNWLYHHKKYPGYLDTRRLTSSRSFTHRQKSMEREIFNQTEHVLAGWRLQPPDLEAIRVFQNEQIKFVMRRY